MMRKAVGAIVFQANQFLLINKTKINTNEGKEDIEGEWDFIKGGVEQRDRSLIDSLLRELKEETGSSEYKIIKQLDEKICFDFPDEIKKKIGYERQETTMFLVEFLGDVNNLAPIDNEISAIRFEVKEKVLDMLTHSDSRDYFINILRV
ncbi:NUDIX domain-containing protein [Cytobacillus sp. FJAT-54145]|uniref:NUDIX domain-containing protein n=1 Tax=Cytobacillus spartinae TaxID=3299023 RepID=A0ABW6K7L5_9BACI